MSSPAGSSLEEIALLYGRTVFLRAAVAVSAPRRPEGSGCGRFVCLGSSKHPFTVLIQRGEGGVFRRIEGRG